MKAVIMAGGQGTRLRPLTSNMPKPMLPVANVPMMEHIVKLLKENEIEDTVVTLQFLPTLVRNHFGDGEEWGVNIEYVTEDTPLGTAGSVKNASHLLDDTFLVISGDALTDIDLSDLIRFHKEKGALVTVALVAVPNPLEFGIVITSEDGRIEKFLEKPTWGQVFSDTINTGIYVIERDVLNNIPDGISYDFSKELFPALLEKGAPLYGYLSDKYWCDIGNLDQFMKAQRDALEQDVDIEIPGFKMQGNIWIGEDTEISSEAVIRGPAVIGNNCKIEGNVFVREYSVIGNNVVVKADAQLNRVVVLDNSYIANGVNMSGCIVGKNCDIKAGARLEQDVAIGDECQIGEGAIINHDVKIYPFKTVEAGSIVNTSIIWESKGVRNLFGTRGISGITNIDVTPEHALRIALAFGSALPKGSSVATSRDASRSARMIKRAIISGLNATGVHVLDLEVSPLPINSFTVLSERASGGIDVRVSPLDPQSVEIRFIDSKGINISEGIQRSIEKFFYQANFRRAFSNEIGAISFPPRSMEHYHKALLKQIDVESIRARRYKMVVDYAFSTASMLMPSLLGEIGCDALSQNSYTDEMKTTLYSEDQRRLFDRLTNTVRVFGADMGIMFDNTAERVFLFDKNGEHIDGSLMLLAMVKLVSMYYSGKIALPLSVSGLAEEIVRDTSCEITRTRISRHSLLEASCNTDYIFAGSENGEYAFPRFNPAFDAMSAILKLLEMLCAGKFDLSRIVSSIPDIYIQKREVVASFEHKGIVMRKLLDREKDKELDLLDGIKIILKPTTWIMITPDPEAPVFHLVSEAESDAEASALISRYEAEISEIMIE